MAVGGDLRLPAVEGPRSRMLRFTNWYVGKLHIAAHVLWGNLQAGRPGGVTASTRVPALTHG